MSFGSARILSPDRDGVDGYVNVTLGGIPQSIRITGEIVDTVLGSRIETIEISGRDFERLPPSTPGLEDTPDDPRYQAIFAYVLRRVKAIHTQWVADAASAAVVEAKPAALVNALPLITPDMLETA